MTALSFGLIASILRMVSSITSSGVICFVRISSANPTASYDDRAEAGAAIDTFGTTPARISPTPIVQAKLDDDILNVSRRLIRMGHLPRAGRASRWRRIVLAAVSPWKMIGPLLRSSCPCSDTLWSPSPRFPVAPAQEKAGPVPRVLQPTA